MTNNLKEYILYTTCGYYGVSQNESKVSSKSHNAIEEFINKSPNQTLQSVYTGNQLCYSVEITPTKNSMIFFKNDISPLNCELNSRHIGIVILSDSAVQTLYNNLKHVYIPLLATNDLQLDTELQESLSQLEVGLRSITLSQDGNRENIRAILSIEDEIEYWKITKTESGSRRSKDSYTHLTSTLQQINEEIICFQAAAPIDIQETAENIGGLLDDIWRNSSCSYPQKRMIRLFDIIGHHCVTRIQELLPETLLWETSDSAICSEALTTICGCLNIMNVWLSACKSLTELYWPNHALYPWTGEVYLPKNCVMFQERLKKIEEIRAVYNQITKLLTTDEVNKLDLTSLFDPLKKVNVLVCSPATENNWNKAVMYFTNAIKPAELKVADKLKSRLRHTSVKQTINEFIRYQTLLERPTFKNALHDKLESFVSSLGGALSDIQAQIDSDEVFNRNNQRPSELSPIIHQVQWAKQMDGKVKQMESILTKLLNDLDGAGELQRTAVKLQVDLKNMYTQCYDEWSRNLQAELKSGKLTLAEEEPVVEFSKSNNLMRVNFNPNLVLLESEIRHLSGLGLTPPPSNVPQLLKRATDALFYARKLQRVAAFHNTSGSRLLSCLRPMLLSAALKLDNLASKRVAWRDTALLEDHVNALTAAAEELHVKNSYLMKQHAVIKSIVLGLLDKDLLVQQSEWKKGFTDIRDLIEKTEHEGYTESGGWRAHWDAQLRESLRVQYLDTLTHIHMKMPPVHVHLQARGETLVFQPPLEDIRSQQYRTLKRLISLPEQFIQLHTENTFSSIVTECNGAADMSTSRIESTLQSLQQIRVVWRRRIGLALFVGAWNTPPARVEPDDFMRDYKSCKNFARTVAEMTFEDEKVEWFTVSVGSLRREMDTSVRTLWSVLVYALRTSCLDDISTLEEFILKTESLSKNEIAPNNTQELTKISAVFAQLVEATPEMQKVVDRLKTKQSMLRNWGGEPLSDGPIHAWLIWLDKMRSQEKLFEHHTERVQRWLQSESERVNNNVELWLRRQNVRISRPPKLEQYSDLKSLYSEVIKAREEFENLKVERDNLLAECLNFNMKLEESDEWQQADVILEKDSKFWNTFSDFDSEYNQIREAEWISFQKKLHTLDEFVAKWESNISPTSSIELFLQNYIQQYKELTPTLKYLRNADLTPKHWAEILALVEIDEIKNPEELRVGNLLDASSKLKRNLKIIQKICSSASTDALVAQSVEEMELWYASARLPVTFCKDRSGKRVPIVANFDILNKIEEQCWRAESLAAGGGALLASWSSRCRAASRLVACLHRAQRRWLYLEPILSGDTGELGRKFRSVDQAFRQVVHSLEDDSRIASQLRSPRLQSTLDNLLNQLNACQTALNNFVEVKRESFPRFYFLSDDDLLEILGQARAGSDGKEAIIQAHLTKLFPGASGVILSDDAMSIIGLKSHEDELIFEKSISLDSGVEIWLKRLEDEMRHSMKNLLFKAVTNTSHRELSLPTQILMLAQNIKFTEQTERAIIKKDLHTLRENVKHECDGYIHRKESDGDGEKFKALVLQCIHYDNVLKSLIDYNVTSPSNWQWLKQLRFYLTSEKKVEARMGALRTEYTYEYLGANFGGFVRTETAEHCFFIITQAIHLGVIGNPFGPAGTGKTESVKALGGLLGRLVLVFNCDEAMDESCIRRIVKGLDLCGAWGCLDEFNRLSEDSMSTLANVYTSTKMTNGAVICTMNPAGGAYGARRAVTSHSAILRPVAAAHASPLSLAEAMLRARDFSEYEHVAKGISSVLALAELVLSDRLHYEWGVRLMKPLLLTDNPAKSLRKHTLSRLTAFDAHSFNALMKQMFPGESFEDDEDSKFKEAIEQSYKDLNLIYNERQARKCKEIYEHMKNRMGIAIIGPPGSGKTTIRKLLKNALVTLGWSIVEHVVCPLAMSRKLLLGYMELDTRQWKEGVISTIAQKIASMYDTSSWLVFDGVPEPEWAEALNSVLDDNRVLTLGAGWRIYFPPKAKIIFEADSLDVASPATVSRLAITLLDSKDGCPTDMLETWMSKGDSTSAKEILRVATASCLNWIAENRAVNMEPIALTRQIMIQYSGIDMDDLELSTDACLVATTLVTALHGLIKPKLQIEFLNQVEMWCGQRVYVSDHSFGVKSALKAQHHLLLFAPADLSLRMVLEELASEHEDGKVVHIKCTQILEPHHLMQIIKMHGATSGNSITLIIEDIERVRVDACGIAPIHDFLFQLITSGGFWEHVGAEGIRWTSARARLILRSAYTNNISARLLGVLSLHYVGPTSDVEMHTMCLSLLEEHADKSNASLDPKNLSELMFDCYKQISDASSMCSVRDLRKWARNLRFYKPVYETAVGYEASRIFGDRSKSLDEKSKIIQIIKKYFKIGEVDFAPRMTSDAIFLEEKLDVEWCSTLQKTIDQCVTDNENAFGSCGAQLSSEFVEICNAIARTLCGAKCCAIVDSDGSLTRSAVSVCAEIFNARVVRATDATTLAQAVTLAGVEDKRTLLLCEESCNIDRKNNILSHLEAILNGQIYQIDDEALSQQSFGSQQFFERVKRNLGVIILLDAGNPYNDELLEDFPMLYQRYHLIHLMSWSRESLAAVPEKIFNRLKRDGINISNVEETKLPIGGLLTIYSLLKCEFSKSPYKYVQFVKSFFLIQNEKKINLRSREKTLKGGLLSLKKAKAQVDELKKGTAIQESALSEKQAKASVALEQISSTVTSATEQWEQMEKLKVQIQRENEQLQKEAEIIEAELADAEPGLARARAAVADIKSESLTEIRSLRAPPDTVRDILEGVLLMMNINDTSWHSMKVFLSKRGVKDDIRNFDVASVSESALQSAERLVKARPSSFTEATAKRASAAAAPLAAWLNSALHYARANQKLAPLRNRHNTLKRNLRQAESQLSHLQGGLDTADGRVASLKEQLNKYTKEALEIEMKLSAAKETIAKAETLVQLLEGESSTWEEDLKNLSREIDELEVRSLLAAALLIYHEEIQSQSQDITTTWCEQLSYNMNEVSLVKLISSTEQQLLWIANGLPNETSYLNNAVIIAEYLGENSKGCVPLIVDPDETALVWLKGTFSKTEFISQHSEHLQTALLHATRFGNVLTITDVTQIDNAWAPLIRGLLPYGFTSINPNFRMILHTKDATLKNRLFLHQSCILSLVEFTPTYQGIVEQLIHFAIEQENPELKEKLDDLKVQLAALEKERHASQVILSEALSKEPDLITDVTTATLLQQSASRTAESKSAARAAQESSKMADGAKNALIDSAGKGTHGLLAARALKRIPTIQTVDLKVIYGKAVSRAIERSKTIEKIDSNEVSKKLTADLLERVLMCVSKSEKVHVAIFVLRHMYPDEITDELWDVLTGSTADIDENDKVNVKSQAAWIDDECLPRLIKLKKTLPGLYEKLHLSDSEKWAPLKNGQDFKILNTLALNPFEKIVVAQCVSLEAVSYAAKQFIEYYAGHPEQLSLRDVGFGMQRAICARGNAGAHASLVPIAPSTPLIIQLKDRSQQDLVNVVLECSKSGRWLFIIVGTAKCDPKIMAALTDRNNFSNEEFRLWIIFEDRDVPPYVSNACVNVLLEPPSGVKNNVLQSLSAWERDGKGEPDRIRALFSLALFHAMVQERRNYIPEGWSRWYSWEWSDATAAKGVSPSAALSLYAARVLHSTDLRTLKALHENCMKFAPNKSTFGEFARWINENEPMSAPGGWRTTMDLAKSLTELHSSHIEDTGKTNVNVKKSLNALLSIWKRLNTSNAALLKGELDPEQVLSSRKWSWRDAFVLCESRAVVLLTRIHSHLARAHTTLTHPHTHLLLADKVPNEWQQLWPGPESALQYLKEVSYRTTHLVNVLNDPNLLDSNEMDLRCFFYPKKYLAVLKCATAERLKCSPDLLVIETEWNFRKPVSDGWIVCTGCRLWGGLKPTGGVTSAPPIAIRYRPKDDKFALREDWKVIPLYTNSSRQSLICMLPATVSHDFQEISWILHASALYICDV